MQALERTTRSHQSYCCCMPSPWAKRIHSIQLNSQLTALIDHSSSLTCLCHYCYDHQPVKVNQLDSISTWPWLPCYVQYTRVGLVTIPEVRIAGFTRPRQCLSQWFSSDHAICHTSRWQQQTSLAFNRKQTHFYCRGLQSTFLVFSTKRMMFRAAVCWL